MNYVVFEAGSRAGLSALIMFNRWQNDYPQGDSLLLVDSDQSYIASEKEHPNVFAMCESDFVDLALKGEYQVFPADELTRQKGHCLSMQVVDIADRWYNKVTPLYYDKADVNLYLAACGVRVPLTFPANEVFLRPNSRSAGSRGCQQSLGFCVTEYIPIRSEYVVDCLVDPEDRSVRTLWGREVKIKNGYDKYVRFLDADEEAVKYANDLIDATAGHGLFSGIFHLQLLRSDDDGKIYFIEASKRISGTSFVNVPYGFSPFHFINGYRMSKSKTDTNKWHRVYDLFGDIVRDGLV